MLVSIIIPVYNRAALLPVAVECALGQSFRPIEIIIIDDGSTDMTGEVASGYAERHPEIRVFRHEENRGVGASRESGRNAARGDFIQHLDSDDWLAPGKVEACVSALGRQAGAAIAYCTTGHRCAEGQLDDAPWKGTASPRDSLFPLLLTQRWWASHSPLFRRDVYMAVGPFKDYRIEEDWEFEGRIGATRAKLVHVEEMLAEVRSHAGPRLGKNAVLPPQLLASRAGAHVDLLGHARRAGVAAEDPVMELYAREVFLIGRQCARAGLDEEMERCLVAASDAAGSNRKLAWQISAFRSARAVLGTRLTGDLSARVVDPGRNLIDAWGSHAGTGTHEQRR